MAGNTGRDAGVAQPDGPAACRTGGQGRSQGGGGKPVGLGSGRVPGAAGQRFRPARQEDRSLRGHDAARRHRCQLAAVLAHEVAHNQEAHAAERINSAMAAQAGTDLAGAVLGAAGVPAPGTVASILGAGAEYGLLLPYSRNQELEADRLGLRIMARAGYDPRAAIALWQQMESQGGQPPAFLSTHPAPGQRIEQLQALMPEALATYRSHD